MKIVNRQQFLQMPEGTVFCKIQFRDPLPGELAYSKNGWDAALGIENPSIKGESFSNDFYAVGIGDFAPKEGDDFEVLHDMGENLGKEVPFEMFACRDGFFDDTHVHFAIYSREEVQQMINELQEALKTAY